MSTIPLVDAVQRHDERIESLGMQVDELFKRLAELQMIVKGDGAERPTEAHMAYRAL
jgi:hypothetical protein